MPRKSVKENKNVYQIARERLDWSRMYASEQMEFISDKKIEAIENGVLAQPSDIYEMAKCYKEPELCNYYCSHDCVIGKKYVPAIEIGSLSDIVIETVVSLNEIMPLTNRLLQIARDGRISEDEIPDFAKILNNLEKVALAASVMKFSVEKMAAENAIDYEQLVAEREKLK